jgi:hypothetical protein
MYYRNIGTDARLWRILLREEAKRDQERPDGRSRSSSKSVQRIRFRGGEKR